MLHDLLLVSDSLPRMQIAFGPLMFGPLSEIYGRSRVLQLANLIYFGTPSSPLSPIRISHGLYFFYNFPSVPYLRLLTPHLSISSARRPIFFLAVPCSMAENSVQPRVRLRPEQRPAHRASVPRRPRWVRPALGASLSLSRSPTRTTLSNLRISDAHIACRSAGASSVTVFCRSSADRRSRFTRSRQCWAPSWALSSARGSRRRASGGGW